MAKCGKHALPASKKRIFSKKTVGAHAISRKGRAKAAHSVKKSGNLKNSFTAANVIRALLLVIICFAMVSPLKGCILTDDDYIGVAAAKQIALDDSGLIADKANDLQADLIKIDGEVYYKIQFTGTVTDYRYIINASSGDIVARAFYHIEGEK